MNRERLTILRDHLASLPAERFDMSIVRQENECGTVACIAGWAGVLAARNGDADPAEYFSLGDAERWLGLDWEQADALFLGGSPDVAMDQTPPTAAAAAIQSMLDNPADDALPVWPEAV